MKNIITLALIAGTLFTAALPAMADDGSRVPNHPRVSQVNGRFENQRDRIQQGWRNGTLQPWEARRLNTEDRNFKREEHYMRREDGGHLTGRDQNILNRQLNRDSRQIYRFKHNE